MNSDYSKLRGKIKEIYKTEDAFAQEMNISPQTLCYKLNSKSDFTSKEIAKACSLLHIDLINLHVYFFNLKTE